MDKHSYEAIGGDIVYSVAVVILNYEAYHETEKCIESIIEKQIEVVGIVIVDNASKNESVPYLKKRYQNNEKVKLLRCHKNMGFAKGNNIGIKAAKEMWRAEFILMLNSDTLILEKDYIKKLLYGYEQGVGVIQSSALRLNGRYTQKNYGLYNLYLMFLDAIRDFVTYYNILVIPEVRYSESDIIGPWVSGCDIMLTPDYFRIFNGLYPLTFLYGEEYILAIMLKKAGLRWKIVEEAHILHAESKSTPADFKEGTRRKQKMMLDSKKHKLLARVLPLKIVKNIVNWDE